jgi:hypothetical protein
MRVVTMFEVRKAAHAIRLRFRRQLFGPGLSTSLIQGASKRPDESLHETDRIY